MNDLERLLAERACERLMVDYARAVDSGRASAIADLFTVDGVWTGDDGRAFDGQDAIRAAFVRRQARTARVSRHVITNVSVDIADDATANGHALLINYRHDRSEGTGDGPIAARQPKFVGDYHLTFAAPGGTWRIRSLRFELAFLRGHEPA